MTEHRLAGAPKTMFMPGEVFEEATGIKAPGPGEVIELPSGKFARGWTQEEIDQFCREDDSE